VYPDIEKVNANRLVPYFLMSSYLYYRKDKAVLSDTDFDLLCKRILAEWKDIEHPHKKLVSKSALVAGTGFSIKKYPTIVMSSAEKWYSDWLLEIENV